MTRQLRPAVLLAVCLAAFLVPAGAAYALWSTTATASVTVSTTSLRTAPTITGCTGGDTSVTVTWTVSPGATEYHVYRAPSGPQIRVSTGTSTTFNESDMGAQNSNGKYSLLVRASDGTESADSNTFQILFKKNQGCAP